MKKIFIFCLVLVLSFSYGAAPIKAESEKSYHHNLKENIVESTMVKRATTSPLSKVELKLSNFTDEYYELEPNNHIHIADTLKLGEDVIMYGSITNYDVDIYKINVTKQGSLAILGVTNSDYDSFRFGLVDKNENFLDLENYYSDDNGVALFYNVKPGTYYIIALDLDNFTGYQYGIQAYMIDLEQTKPNKPKVNQVADNDTRVTGTAEPYTYVSIQIEDDWAVEDVYVGSSGKFSIKIKPQKAGTFIGVTVVDEDGNQSDFTRLWVVDKTPPKTLKVNKVSSKSTSVKGKTEANATVEVKLGSKSLGKGKANSKGEFTVKIKKQKKGKKLKVIARDKAKNAKSINITVK